MSEQIVTYKSGAFEGSKEELRRQVATAVGNGAFQGMIQTIAKVSPELAQRTGRFRRAFATAAQEIIREQIGNERLRIDVDDIARKMKGSVTYAEYHIDAKPHHPGDTTPYENPTTPGTAPLDTDEVQRVAVKEIRKSVLDNLRSAGLDFVIKK